MRVQEESLRLARRPSLVAGTALAAIVWIGAPALGQTRPGAPPGDGSALRDIVASGHLSDLRWPDFSDYVVWLTRFYEPAGYAPAWIQAGQPIPQALSM